MSSKIIKLIGFLIANLCHDEKEWKEWALPFINLLLLAQEFSEAEKKTISSELNGMFVTMIDSNVKLVCDEGDGFIVLHIGQLWWEEAISQDKLEEELSDFLNRYIAWTSTSKLYDSRARVVAKKMFDVLQSHDKFVELEQKILHDSEGATQKHPFPAKKKIVSKVVTKPTNSGEKDDESADIMFENDVAFQQHLTYSRNQTFSSEINSRNMTERIWKVSLAATIGASIMSVAAISTGPAICASIVALLGDSTLSQFFVGMMAIMTSYGVTSSSVMGTIGAYSATMKMLHRTESLQEFRLKHLCKDNGGKKTRVTAPMYVLIPGHCNYVPADHLDALIDSYTNNTYNHIQTDRDVWGADPSIQDMEILPTEQGVSTSVINEHITIMDYFTAKLMPADSSASKPVVMTNNAAGNSESKPVALEKVNLNQEIVSSPPEDSSSSLTPPYNFIFQRKDRYSAYEVPSPPVASISTATSGSQGAVSADMEKSWDVIPPDQANKGWWRDVIQYGDEYLLQWDRSTRDNLSRSLHEYISSNSLHYITHELLMLTPAATILSATALPWPLNILNKSIDSLDNPWSIAIEKSKQAGRLLAILLLMQYESDMDKHASTNSAYASSSSNMTSILSSINNYINTGLGKDNAEGEKNILRSQLQEVLPNETDVECAYQFITMSNDTSSTDKRMTARRPITLIGYGIGARVIIHCLETLVTEYQSYSNKDYIRGLIENVVLMGTPFGTNRAAWEELRSIIPGRFINCYSTRDWLLALMFRQCTWELGVAGLGPVSLCSSASPVPVKEVEVSENASGIGKDDLAPTTDVNNGNVSTSTSSSRTSVPTPIIASIRNKESDQATVPFGGYDIENVDITALIRSHADYPNALQLIIPLLHLEA